MWWFDKHKWLWDESCYGLWISASAARDTKRPSPRPRSLLTPLGSDVTSPHSQSVSFGIFPQSPICQYTLHNCKSSTHYKAVSFDEKGACLLHTEPSNVVKGTCQGCMPIHLTLPAWTAEDQASWLLALLFQQIWRVRVSTCCSLKTPIFYDR